MMRWLTTLCLLAVFAGFLAAQEKKPAEGKAAVKLKATSLTMHKPLPAKPGTVMFNPSGMSLDVNVSGLSKFILAIDNKASKLESLTDDKKNDLHKGKGAFTPNWLNEFMTRYDPEGEHCTIQIVGAEAPGKGARKILVKASLIVKCGAGEKTTEKKEITLKTNEEVSVGDFKVKVNNAGPFGAGLSVLSAEPRVKSVAFFDAAGKALKIMSQGRGTNPFGPGGKPQSFVSYFFSGKTEKLSFQLTYFDKIESVNVPLDLRVGLDLE